MNTVLRRCLCYICNFNKTIIKNYKTKRTEQIKLSRNNILYMSLAYPGFTLTLFHENCVGRGGRIREERAGERDAADSLEVSEVQTVVETAHAQHSPTSCFLLLVLKNWRFLKKMTLNSWKMERKRT